MGTNIKTRFRLILTILVLLFVGVSSSLYFLKDIVGKVKISKVKVAEIKRDVSLLDKISQEKNQYSDNIDKIKSTLPSKYYEISFFTTELERLAQNNGLNMQININENKKEETSTVNSISYLLEIDGNYTSVSNFLTQLSNLPYHTNLERLEFSRKEDQPAVKITFKLFTQ
ncbi:type 4a pilus biogenesis protein PilO [Patescibacteria group bacterium]